MHVRFEQFNESKVRLYPELHKSKDGKNILSKTVTFKVTDDCNLACTYCYQINKCKKTMSLETGKKFVDLLLSATEENNSYINPTISPFIALDFIGGEPFLEIDLIDQIMDYFIEQAFEMHHPWATRYIISICSNGVLYFEPNVQRFLNKHKNHLSLSITVDGDKELHDSCRLFPDGRPSYDLAIAAALDWAKIGGDMGSKITICPQNIDSLGRALKHFVNNGYTEINANCVYEKGWQISDATKLYNEMKNFSDFLLEENLETSIYCSLYEETFFQPKPEHDLQNWCGGTGDMLACDTDGLLYPCIRYMDSSLGIDQSPMVIGDVNHGIEATAEEQQIVKCLNCIDRRTQSTDECFYCPIAAGCSWCSAYNYQVFGTPNKRATFICDMHKARSLANVYFWNKTYRKNNMSKRMKLYCPKEWAIPIIGEEEYNYLLDLSNDDN